MKRKNIHQPLKRSLLGLSAFVLLCGLVPINASATPVTARSLTIGSSAPSDVTTYSFAFELPSSTVVQSASFTACTTATGACVTPTGFSVSGASLTAQPTNLGDAAGWTEDTTTAGSLRISHATNATAPTGSQIVSFSDVTNPSDPNATFFIRIATFSDDAWVTGIDEGTVAASTATQIEVTLAVDEALTFCTGTSITGQNCGTVAGSTVDLGTASTSATASGTSVMAASTNGAGGYTIIVNGTTLTSGLNTITALETGDVSIIGTEQFGLNLVSNTTPAVGEATTGVGTALPVLDYGTPDTFRFASGEALATVTGPTNANTFTVSYIANIEGLTEAGSYTSNLTYIATANF
jgi:hypothetical protein